MDTIAHEDQLPPKPKQVTYAVYLISAAILAGILMTLIDGVMTWPARVENTTAPVAAIVTLCLASFYIIPIGLVVLINGRRNWARLLYLALFILSLVYLGNLIRGFGEYPLLAVSSAISTILQFAAILLLFQRPSSAWFKAQEQKAPHQPADQAELTPGEPAENASAAGLSQAQPAMAAGPAGDQAYRVKVAAAAGAIVGFVVFLLPIEIIALEVQGGLAVPDTICFGLFGALAGAVAAATSTIAITAIIRRAFGKEISVVASTLLAIAATIILLLTLSFCSVLAMAA